MRLVLDIETELINENFRAAATAAGRLRHAPKPRLACVYVEHLRRYRFFHHGQFKELLQLLRRAKEIITFNGKQFDFLVIRKHLGMKRDVFKRARNTDVFEILHKKAGFRVSLDAAARHNLNESKKYKGIELATAPPTTVKDGCRSDVRQTYRLWKLYQSGKLKAPPRWSRRSFRVIDDDYHDTVGQFKPDRCPKCDAKGTLELIELDMEQMSDGQMAEYLAGTWGDAICRKCKEIIPWEA